MPDQPTQNQEPTQTEPAPQAAPTDSLTKILQATAGTLQKLGHDGQCAIVFMGAVVNDLGEAELVFEPSSVQQNGHIMQAALNLVRHINISRPKRQPQGVLENPTPAAAAPAAAPPQEPSPIKPERKRRKR